MAKPKTLRDWTEFQHEVAEVLAYRSKLAEDGYVPSVLFRGQSSADWPLNTTLERYNPNVTTWLDYFRIALRAQSEIESLTDRKWNLPESKVIDAWVREPKSPLSTDIPGYDYLVYLRHHGFPSPLLDWSRSPYVAAFFAFRSRSTSEAAIYAYLELAGKGKSWSSKEPMIQPQGKHVTAHARHVYQQCEYTICTSFDEELQIAQHENVFARNDEDQDLLWKFILPASERMRVLRELDAYNLNAFSLFQTEDALLETTALREIEFRGDFHQRRAKD
jgi:FRG domain